MQETSSTEYPGLTTVSIYLADVCARRGTPAVCLHICRLLGVSWSRWLGWLYVLCRSVDLICSWVSLPPRGSSELVRASSSHRGAEVQRLSCTREPSEDECWSRHIVTFASFCWPERVTRPGPQTGPFLQWEELESHWAKDPDKGGRHFWTASVTYNIFFFFNCYFFLEALVFYRVLNKATLCNSELSERVQHDIENHVQCTKINSWQL